MQGIDNWEYSKFVYTVGRSLRFNPAVAGSAELTAAQTFYNNEYVTRPWLISKFIQNSEAQAQLDNVQLLGKQISEIGRDMLKIPIQNAFEKGYCDTLFTATGDRKFGKKGGPAQAIVVGA